MERNANYGMIGLGTVMLFLGLLVFIVWLAGSQFTKSYTLYDIIFVGPVQDFSEGAEVQFNGIKVGVVTHIALEKVNPKNVIARIRVTSDVPIKVDSLASLEPQGITGVDHVQLTAGTTSQPLLKDVTPPGEVPVIRSKTSAMADLIRGGGTVLSATAEALNRVNRVLSDDNIKTLGVTLANVRDVTTAAAQQKQILADADATLKTVGEAAKSIKSLSESSRTLVDGDARRALHDAGDAAEQIKGAATDTRALVARLQGPAGDFATNGLPRLTSAVASLQQAAVSLKRLSDEAQQSPRGLLAKAPAKQVDIKP